MITRLSQVRHGLQEQLATCGQTPLTATLTMPRQVGLTDVQISHSIFGTCGSKFIVKNTPRALFASTRNHRSQGQHMPKVLITDGMDKTSVAKLKMHLRSSLSPSFIGLSLLTYARRSPWIRSRLSIVVWRQIVFGQYTERLKTATGFVFYPLVD